MYLWWTDFWRVDRPEGRARENTSIYPPQPEDDPCSCGLPWEEHEWRDDCFPCQAS